MSQDLKEQVWALSALFLAVDGVVSLASKGQCPEGYFRCLMPSLSRFDCDLVRDFYDCEGDFLERGRVFLVERFSGEVLDERLSYAMQLMRVAKKLSKNKELMFKLRSGLEETMRQIPMFSLLHDNIFARYDDLYQKTASQSARRIMIKGSAQVMQQVDVVRRVRTLLLCGVRACALWQANGGSRLQVFFARGALLEQALKMRLTI